MSIEDWKNDLYKLIEEKNADSLRVGYAEVMHKDNGYLGLTVYLTNGEFMYSYYGRMSEYFTTKEDLAQGVIGKIEKIGYRVIDTSFRFTLT